MLRMGPVLSFRGYRADDHTWNLTALVVSDGDPGPLSFGNVEVAPEELWRVGKSAAFRFSFSAELTDTPSTFTYSLDGKSYDVALPGIGLPPTMAYASCNGFSSLKLMKGVKDKLCLWRQMADRHAEQPYNLLLQGGDQVYADSMWETVPAMEKWNQLSYRAGNAAKYTARMQRELERFYFELYQDRWSQPEMAAMLATVPTVAMWDDHDLIDGWGSYPAERQNSQVFQGIGRVATKAFSVFQQHLADEERRPLSIASRGFTLGFTVGRFAILALDMRFERTEDQVISPDVWNDIYGWLSALSWP